MMKLATVIAMAGLIGTPALAADMPVKAPPPPATRLLPPCDDPETEPSLLQAATATWSTSSCVSWPGHLCNDGAVPIR
jgi:hypothetical protein